MDDLMMKKKVAQEIMDLMDKHDGDRLKSKSPKFAKMEVLSVEPKKDGEESSESGLEMMKEKSDPSLEAKEGDEEELSPEMIQKLLEMVSGK